MARDIFQALFLTFILMHAVDVRAARDKETTMKLVRCAVLTLFALLCSLAVAQAQLAHTVQSPGPAITPELHEALTGGSTGEINVGSLSATQAVAVPIGFNFVHAVLCAVYSDGVNTFFYLFAAEGSVWLTTNLVVETTIAPACQTGNLVAFFVINTNGVFNQVRVFPSP
jgi:hypothetical protein